MHYKNTCYFTLYHHQKCYQITCSSVSVYFKTSCSMNACIHSSLWAIHLKNTYKYALCHHKKCYQLTYTEVYQCFLRREYMYPVNVVSHAFSKHLPPDNFRINFYCAQLFELSRFINVAPNFLARKLPC